MLGGKDNLLTPAQDWIHNCIWDWHQELDPEVGSSLGYEYSVTQSPPGDYIYVKWWDGGPVFTSLAEKVDQKWKNVFLAPKGAGLRLFLIPYFWGMMV